MADTTHQGDNKDLIFARTLGQLEPSKIVRGGVAREPQLTARQITAIYDARKRNVSWKDIHTALQAQGLVTNYTRASTLAQVVHECARKHGIEPYITVKRPEPASA